MINFDLIEKDIYFYSNSFSNAEPFPHVVIDDFCNENLKENLIKIPNPNNSNINKSRDYIFAKNKYEKSNFKIFSNGFNELYEDLISQRFKNVLFKITKQNVFVDELFHGGGLHQGGKNSFLDMHVDFNYHPIKTNWFRNLNILLYLNENWKTEYKGQLELKNINKNLIKTIDPIFNRCVIMFTRDYTLHGYNKINFPEGHYRRSIAAYAYNIDNKKNKVSRSTVWYPQNSNYFKKSIGIMWPKIVKIKNFFFGSSTKKNK